MATTLFFRLAGQEIHTGNEDNRPDGAAGSIGWQYFQLSTTRGGSAVSTSTSTVNGPTNGVWLVGSEYLAWLSDPLDTDVTISGTITFNLRSAENNMSANAAVNAQVVRVDNQMQVQEEVIKTARTTELGTTEAAANFTGTPTSTAFNKGDRIKVVVYFDDATSNMATGFTCTFWYDGPTGGASGDSFITFNETFGFITASPAGSQLFLLDAAGPAVGSAVEKEMWTSRGAAADSLITDVTVTGWVSPIQLTNGSGGAVVEWYSRPLTAFTLSGLINANIRMLRNNAGVLDSKIRVEVAVVNGDGSSPVVYAAGNSNTVILTTESANTVLIAGDDLAVSSGQRLRLRVFADDSNTGPIAGGAGEGVTIFFDGPTGGASGDSWIQLTQSVTEFVPSPPFWRTPRLVRQAVKRSAIW